MTNNFFEMPICFVIVVLFLNACQNEQPKKYLSFTSPKEIATPCKEGGEPNLFTSETGMVYLSWVEYLNDTTDALRFSTLENGKWTSPKTIAKGSAGTYDYDVHIAQSFDAGKTWQASFIPHRDSIAAEHGFVSMLPLSANKIFATWLDGRNTKGEGHTNKEHGHGHHGAMTLRSAIFDKSGALTQETELDNRICDCCQTRTSPKKVYNDNWKIAGCPVNGPVIKADGAFVAIAWYSMPKGKAEVKVAFSEDSGATFQPPIKIDRGNPLGRIAIELLPKKKALVSWLENGSKEATIRAVKIGLHGKIGDDFILAKTDAARDSGFPVMTKTGKQLVFAWTQVGEEKTSIKSAVIKL